MLAPPDRRFRFCLAAVVAVFLVVACGGLDVPGLYMDAVNPDYLALYFTRPHGTVPAWIFPDNMLSRGMDYPLLNSLYGGNLPAYLGRPLWQWIGYSAITVHLVHVLFGALIVAGVMAVAKVATASNRAAVIAGLVVGTEATFVYAWRTQYYLQLFPLLFMLPGLALIAVAVRDWDRSPPLRTRVSAVLGAALPGAAAWGYFIYAFYAAVIVVLAVVFARQSRFRLASWLCAAFVVGYLPYLFAHLSLLSGAGVKGYLAYLHSLQSTYGVMNGQAESLFDKIGHTIALVLGIANGHWVGGIMCGFDTMPRSTDWIGHLVIGVAAVLLVVGALFAFARHWRDKEPLSRPDPARFILCCLAGGTAVHLALGFKMGCPPLGFQHFILMDVTLLLGAVLGLHQLGKTLPEKTTPALGKLASLACIGFLTFNTINDRSVHRALHNTGGAGMFTESINDLGEMIRSSPPGSVVLFPQWGYWMGAEMTSGGTREIWAGNSLAELAPRLENDHRDVPYLVALTADESTDTMWTPTGMPPFASKPERELLDLAGRCGLIVQARTFLYDRRGHPTIAVYRLTRHAEPPAPQPTQPAAAP